MEYQKINLLDNSPNKTSIMKKKSDLKQQC